MAELSKTARASMKGEKKDVAIEEVTLEKALKVIKGGLEAKLFIPVHFWEVILKEYESVQSRLDSSVKELRAKDVEISSLKEQILDQAGYVAPHVVPTMVEVSTQASEDFNEAEAEVEAGTFSHPDGTVGPVNGASE